MSLSQNEDPQIEDEVLEGSHAKQGENRREFLQRSPVRLVILAALVKLGIPGANEAFASEAKENEGEKEAELRVHAENISHDSMGLRTLDIVGFAGFVDAIVAIAMKRDSIVQQMCVFVGIPTYNTGELKDSHDSKFPLENIYFAMILNAMRCVFFGEEVREHTIHEAMTTLKGVALLMGLTSVAKGIVAVEGQAGKMAMEDSESVRNNPEERLARSIFQLTRVAYTTQLPLTAFGNAAIGDGEFREVKESFQDLYLSPIKNIANSSNYAATLEAVEEYANDLTNPVVKKNILSVCNDERIDSVENLKLKLKHASEEHSKDLMTILMSTACDDAQAAAGDAGPLVGLYQSFGSDFMLAIPSILPYTMLIGYERGIFAAKRAGIPVKTVFTREREQYLKEFWKTTWKNLILYFTRVAPKITSAVTGSEYIEAPKGDRVGRDFSLVEQVMKDAEKIIGTFSDAVLGSFNGDTLDVRKVRSAVKTMESANRSFQAELGKELLKKNNGYVSDEDEDETVLPVNREAIEKMKNRMVGAVSEEDELGTIQRKLEELTLEDDGEIMNFAAELKRLRKDLLPEIEAQLAELMENNDGKKTPSIHAVSKLLQKNPKIADLLDFNHWHHTIGPELTDTMFVVFLQGLHLPFIISTIEKYFYGAEAFRSLPLMAQEWLSVGLNDFVSMFADNWADCVAHSKWLTVMYFNKLDEHVENICEIVPETRAIIDAGYFEDDSTKIVPNRFKRRRQQVAALIESLVKKNPDKEVQLREIISRYFTDSYKYYSKALVMSMLTAVTGGGKALTGNAPHFTFAANQEDFDLNATLGDFRRHPLYHLWEFIFSTTYSTVVGPILAQGMGQFFGTNAANELQKMLQARFRDQFPEFEKKLEQLKASEREQSANNNDHFTPDSVRAVNRRGFFGVLAGKKSA